MPLSPLSPGNPFSPTSGPGGPFLPARPMSPLGPLGPGTPLEPTHKIISMVGDTYICVDQHFVFCGSIHACSVYCNISAINAWYLISLEANMYLSTSLCQHIICMYLYNQSD